LTLCRLFSEASEHIVVTTNWYAVFVCRFEATHVVEVRPLQPVGTVAVPAK
jgi:hypothetical protein